MSQPVQPATPPQTTDDDSESSDPSHTVTSVTTSSDNMTTYLTSCQLTPPTPPTFTSSTTSATEIHQASSSSPQPHDQTLAEVTTLNVCRKRGRHRLPVSALGTNTHKNSTSECDKIKSFITNSSICEETGADHSPADHSPVRKTRRKSLRIREISRQQKPETSFSEGTKEKPQDDMSTSRRICQTSNDLLTSSCRTSTTDSLVAASVDSVSNHIQPAFHLSHSPRESSMPLSLCRNNHVNVEGWKNVGGKGESREESGSFLLTNVATNNCSESQWQKSLEETAETVKMENLEKAKCSIPNEVHPIKIWKKLAEATVENVLNRDGNKQTWDSSGKNPKSEYVVHSNSRHATLQSNVLYPSSHLLGHNSSNTKEHLQQTTSEQLRRFTDLQRQMQLQCRKQHILTSSRSGIPPSLVPMLSSHLQTSQQKVPNVSQTTANHHLHQLHQLQMHQDDETHVCVECRKVFKRSIYLQRHMAREHWTTAKLFRCDTCSYETKHQSNLLVHKRTHTGERPYYCGACGQRYTQGHLLKAHIRSRHFSNMQLYNMEKRSPSEVLAAQAAAGDSNEKRRSPGDASGSRKINIPSASAKSGDGFETATVSKACAEERGHPSDTMKLLIEAAYHGQNSFCLHNRNQQKSLLKPPNCYNDNSLVGVKVERPTESSPLEENEIVNHSKAFNFAKPFFQQKLMKAEPLSLADGELKCITPVRVGNRSVVESNGEVIDLDTPEPLATSSEISPDREQISEACHDRLATESHHRESLTSASTSAVLSAISKQAAEKYSNISGHSLFPYFSLLNNFQNSDRYTGFPPINGSYLSTPPPPSLSSINNSIIYKTFSEKNMLDCIGSINSSRNCHLPSWGTRSPSNFQAPVNISSGSENDCEDQFVDVDGDDDDDDDGGNCTTPLNLTTNRPETPLNENINRLTPIEEFPRDLTKSKVFNNERQIEEEIMETKGIDDPQHSAFETFYKPEEYQPQPLNNPHQPINHVSLNHSGDDEHNDTSQKSSPVKESSLGVNGNLYCQQDSDSMLNNGAMGCVDVSPTSMVNRSGLLTTHIFDRDYQTPTPAVRPTSGEFRHSTAAPSKTPGKIETRGSFHDKDEDSVSVLCPNSRCPDRLKLESLRRNVYKMLRVFMPYLGLDEVEDCRTDALDQFLHEVLYSKLDG